MRLCPHSTSRRLGCALCGVWWRSIYPVAWLAHRVRFPEVLIKLAGRLQCWMMHFGVPR